MQLADEFMFWLRSLGLVFNLAGALIVVRGELTSSAAQIVHFWNNIENSWAKKKPNWFEKLTCLIAKRFGSKNVLDLQGSTVSSFQSRFWGFVFLFVGFLLQFIALLIEKGLFKSAN